MLGELLDASQSIVPHQYMTENLVASLAFSILLWKSLVQ